MTSFLTSTRLMRRQHQSGQSIPSIFTILLCTLLFSPILSASAYSLLGCYSSSGSLTFNSDNTFQSSSLCYSTCDGSKYMGLTKGNGCWCGDSAPSSSDLTDSSDCSTNCFGYDQETCGGDNSFDIFLMGTKNFLESSSGTTAGSGSSNSASASSGQSSGDNGKSSNQNNSGNSKTSTTGTTSTGTTSTGTTSTPSTTPTNPSSSPSSVLVGTSNAAVISLRTTTAEGATIVITATVTTNPNSSSTGGSNNGGSNKDSGSSVSGGTIAGAVVGAIAGLALVAGLVFYFLKRRARNQYNLEASSPHGIPDPFGDDNDNKMNAFGAGGVGSVDEVGSDGFMSIDQRLNPVMLNRRLSEGSLADDQDYSRKILRVANPED